MHVSINFYPSPWNTVDHSININFEGSCTQAEVFKGGSDSEISSKEEFNIAATICSLTRCLWVAIPVTNIY